MYEGEKFRYCRSIGKWTTAIVVLCKEDRGISIVDFKTGDVLACLLYPTDYKRIGLLIGEPTWIAKSKLEETEDARLEEYKRTFEATCRNIEEAIKKNRWDGMLISTRSNISGDMTRGNLACPAR